MNKGLETQTEGLPSSSLDLGEQAVEEISGELRRLLADVFTLYLKTKNFHWHMTGRHFRDYHLLLDEQAEKLFAMTDDIAERSRKIGGTTLRSIGDISRTNALKTTIENPRLPTRCFASYASTIGN